MHLFFAVMKKSDGTTAENAMECELGWPHNDSNNIACESLMLFLNIS